MEQNNKYKINPIVLVAIVFEFIFVVFVIITISNFLKQETEVVKMGINNFSIISDGSVVGEIGSNKKLNFNIDDVKKSVIEGTLYDEVSFNNVGDIYRSNAKIRDGSVYYAYISELEIYFLNFIVDIEGLQQSYHIVYRWSEKSPNENVPADFPIIAFCPRDDELIYGDFDCRDSYDGYGNDIAVHDLLFNKTFENSALGIYGDVYNGEPLRISINTYSDDEVARGSAVEEVSSYLSSVGFDLNDFDYTVGVRFAE